VRTGVIRWLFLTHRYLGMAVGLLMVMWCLSGIVMMYVRYPSLSETQRNDALQPIEWAGCCTVRSGVDARLPVRGLEIEMLAGRPVMRIAQGDGPARLVDLTDGMPIAQVTAEQAWSVAAGFGAKPAAMHRIDRDQWSVSGEFGRDRPLYRFDMGDAARTQVYVSSTTGKAVQIATGSQRFWNWLGAVPHWLYFTRLRADPALWSQVVIWTSLTGCFLTGTGLYLGVRQLRSAPDRRWSYRGFLFWHHLPGLVFGVFALTWVASGLVSMNPWGFLDSDGAQPADLRGPPPSGGDIAAAVPALGKVTDAVSITLATFDGKLAFVATAKDGTRRRLDAAGQTLSPPDMARTAALLRGGSADLLDKGDAYYFASRGRPAPLPVYRIVAGTIRYYLDPLSGEVVRTSDTDDRWFRWLHEGLHRLDFTPALRNGMFRTLAMLPLMLGVTLVCGTGAWLGLRRLLR